MPSLMIPTLQKDNSGLHVARMVSPICDIKAPSSISTKKSFNVSQDIIYRHDELNLDYLSE